MARQPSRQDQVETAPSAPADVGLASTVSSRGRAKVKSLWRSVLSTRQAWRVLIYGLILISVPTIFKAGFVNYPRTHWILEKLIDICGKAGDALLIAVLLIVTTIDEETRLKLIEVVVRAASPKLIARHLPDAVQATVFSYFGIDFVRPNMEIEFILEQLPGKDYLKVVSRVRGTVKHCGSSAEVFEFAGFIDPPVVDAAEGEPQISAAQLETEDGTVLFNLPGGQQALKQSDGSYVFQVQRPFLPGMSYYTTLETVEYRPKSYILPLFIGTTVVTATVNAVFPKNDFDVKLQLPTISGKDPVPTDTYLGKEWHLHDPLLPGQCMLLTWWPKHAATASPAAASAASPAAQV